MKVIWTLFLLFSVVVTNGQYPVYTPPVQHEGHVIADVPAGYQSYYRLVPPIPQVSIPLVPSNYGRAAVCNLIAASASKVSGQINLHQASDAHAVEVSGSIQGLSPGLHGFHLHRDGKTDNDCKGAGPHFNPYNKTHGGPHDEIRHAGDFGNIIANEYGQADFQLLNTQLSLQPGNEVNAVGHAFVVHAGVDDLGKGGNEESLKTGNAGGRLACCVVEAIEY